MTTDEDISRSVMWLCFGTALLLLLAKVGVTNFAPAILAKEAESPPVIQKIVTFARSALERPPSGKSSASKVRLVVDLSDRRLYHYHADRLKAVYPIAIGQKGWETPTGKFKVLHMEKNPVWEQPINGRIVTPGEENPLGDRWIGFWTDGVLHIGIHGTSDESQIGQAISHGCLRMRNSEMRRLYEQVTLGTTIKIQD